LQRADDRGNEVVSPMNALATADWALVTARVLGVFGAGWMGLVR
jgi:hypothetical protein